MDSYSPSAGFYRLLSLAREIGKRGEKVEGEMEGRKEGEEGEEDYPEAQQDKRTGASGGNHWG